MKSTVLLALTAVIALPAAAIAGMPSPRSDHAGKGQPEVQHVFKGDLSTHSAVSSGKDRGIVKILAPRNVTAAHTGAPKTTS